MSAIRTVGLPMWQVSMIAWRRRSEKRLNQLIGDVYGVSIRLFGLMLHNLLGPRATGRNGSEEPTAIA